MGMEFCHVHRTRTRHRFHRCEECFPPEEEQQAPACAETLDLFAAREARDEALARVEENADPEWKERAFRAVEAVCENEPEFTVDSLWRHVEKPKEPRALGAVMQAAKRAGLCEPTGRVTQSAQLSNHARPVMIWRSRLHRGAA